MSRSLASERRSRRLLTGAVLAALVLGLFAQASDVFAQRRATPDTSRAVSGVRVTDRGIEIRQGDSTVIETSGESGSRTIRIGPGGVQVEHSDGSGDRVRIDGPAIIVDSDDGDVVRVFADATVPAGRRVEGDVVAVFGSVHVDGDVEGTVVGVLGSVVLGPEARVSGDAVAVGGVLNMAPGAVVDGETVSVGFLPVVSWGVPTLPILLITILAGFLLSFFVGWILFVLAPERMGRTARTVARRTGASLLVGLIAPPLVIITIGLLFITVIGIPGAFLLPVLYGAVLWAGQLAAAYVLGSKVLRRDSGGPIAIAPLAAGLGFVALFFVAGALLATPPGIARTFALFFSLFGALLVIGLSCVGSGALILSRMGSRDEGEGRAGASATPPPAAPPAAPASPAGATPPASPVG